MSYTNYPRNTRVLIKSTGEHGDAFESALGCISIFVDGEERCRYFSFDDVVFLNGETKRE